MSFIPEGIDHALAEKVLNKILESPENFNMSSWFYDPEMTTNSSFEGEVSCDTTLCVAGWVDMLTEGSVHIEDIARRSARKLGLTSTTLFHVSNEQAIAVLEHMVDPSSTPESVHDMIDDW